ncbi:MAK1-like monooxygenase [Penicillium subrubescens]|uniref:MAK1-like monooxygenase n=1 Tax=Penicillium subrubescens TaxID=1316194 RepID=UPI0025451C7D|nr:MAK1-like monooxygenase [Penicillium subrubescens]KAJ5900323.1 MAK1-like monooxygenase [Penicillium subrubescens]
MTGFRRGDSYFLNRCDLANILYEYARDIGVEVRFNAKVTDYWETDSNTSIIVDSSKVAADCVIASDGLYSKARGFVTGSDPAPVSLGYAAFRAYFDVSEILSDPTAHWLLKGAGKTRSLCVPSNGERLLYRSLLTLIPTATLPCRDKIAPIIRYTLAKKAINFPILIRPPLDTWLSPLGCIILTEDTAVLAITLELATKDNVPLGLKIAEKIRGKENHDSWHRPDWEAIKKNPNLIKTPRPT